MPGTVMPETSSVYLQKKMWVCQRKKFDFLNLLLDKSHFIMEVLFMEKMKARKKQQ